MFCNYLEKKKINIVLKSDGVAATNTFNINFCISFVLQKLGYPHIIESVTTRTSRCTRANISINQTSVQYCNTFYVRIIKYIVFSFFGTGHIHSRFASSLKPPFKYPVFFPFRYKEGCPGRVCRPDERSLHEKGLHIIRRVSTHTHTHYYHTYIRRDCRRPLSSPLERETLQQYTLIHFFFLDIFYKTNRTEPAKTLPQCVLTTTTTTTEASNVLIKLARCSSSSLLFSSSGRGKFSTELTIKTANISQHHAFFNKYRYRV